MSEFSLPHDHGDNHGASKINQKLVDTKDFDIVANLFKQISDPTRVRIFWILSHREECVTNIAALTGISSPAVCHHLRPLRECNLIESRRYGKEVYYRTSDTKECKMLHDMIEGVMKISCPSTEDALSHSQKETAKRVHDYMLENLDSRITIEELSKKFLVNTTTLKTAFKEVYRDSIASHVHIHRMEKAESMLCLTTESIAEIAKKVGFSSQSKFCQTFKNEFGCTPGEYRKSKQ